MLLKPSRFVAAVFILIIVLTQCLIAYRYLVRSSASQYSDRMPTILETFHQLLSKVQPSVHHSTS
ncbi:hypothetical protein BofuT4_P114680.1 [Botrytis cinerea T4]|uniref:Uncharacterized protein n=1 Tax=Botryotinia fuckeliana (strain T4) TaxID=999810 RepID=G2Y272_BOTF4|nr:hypothetical protein BofuT4_P114680.1 [Botrytis cinerea T4]